MICTSVYDRRQIYGSLWYISFIHVFHDELSISSNKFNPLIHDLHVHVLVSANNIEFDRDSNNEARDHFVH